MRRPQPQELYRHFKGNMYQIIAIAKHSETMEEMVVYQALYGDYGFYVRPLDMFVSEVDHVKYPDVKQKYRFELITDRETANQQTTQKPMTDEAIDMHDRTLEEEAAEYNMNPHVLEFLDASSAAQRLEILQSFREDITNDMIDVMAMAIDTKIEDGEPEDRLAELKQCLRTIERFECTRLR